MNKPKEKPKPKPRPIKMELTSMDIVTQKAGGINGVIKNTVSGTCPRRRR